MRQYIVAAFWINTIQLVRSHWRLVFFSPTLLFLFQYFTNSVTIAEQIFFLRKRREKERFQNIVVNVINTASLSEFLFQEFYFAVQMPPLKKWSPFVTSNIFRFKWIKLKLMNPLKSNQIQRQQQFFDEISCESQSRNEFKENEKN